MLIVRGTKKLRDRVEQRAEESQASTTVLGDWFATALFWKPQVALLVNERTFLPVFMPLAPAATLLDRAPDAIATILRRHGVDEAFIADELEAMRDVRLAPTNNRSVLGVMNGFEFHGKFRFDTASMDLEDLSMELAQTPIDPLRGRTGSPDRELATILGDDRSNVIAFPTGGRAAASTDRGAARGAHHGDGRRGGSVYQLKVTLNGTKPPVWRRILVDGSATLDQLHEVIQGAFGWWNYHLHEFEIGGTRYGIPDPDWDFGPPTRDERRTRLDKVAKVGSSFRYTYDFGDYWEHRIKVEKVLDASADRLVPSCVDGRRACPPEDCGGPWGYMDLLAILADPTHPEHAERVEWVEGMHAGPFQPEAFDPAEFDDNLHSLRLAVFDD